TDGLDRPDAAVLGDDGRGGEVSEGWPQTVDASALVVDGDQRTDPGAQLVQRGHQVAELAGRAHVAPEQHRAAGRMLGEHAPGGGVETGFGDADHEQARDGAPEEARGHRRPYSNASPTNEVLVAPPPHLC